MKISQLASKQNLELAWARMNAIDCTNIPDEPAAGVVDAAQHVAGTGLGVPDLDVADQGDQLAKPPLVNRRPGVVSRQHVLERGVVALKRDHRLIYGQADSRLPPVAGFVRIAFFSEACVRLYSTIEVETHSAGGVVDLETPHLIDMIKITPDDVLVKLKFTSKIGQSRNVNRYIRFERAFWDESMRAAPHRICSPKWPWSWMPPTASSPRCRWCRSQRRTSRE